MADDINVASWLDTLQTVVKAGAGQGCYGVKAAAALVRAMVVETRTRLDALPRLVEFAKPRAAIDPELAQLESRTAAYIERLQSLANPPTTDDRIWCDRIYFWLITGKTPDEPPMLPVLAMGDAALAANLWNQVAHLKAADDEASDTVTWLRELYSDASKDLQSAAGGAHDAVTDALDAAAARAAELVAQAREDALSILKWGLAAAAIVAVLYFLITSRSK